MMLLKKGFDMVLETPCLNKLFNRKKSKLLTILMVLFMLPLSHAEDLLHDELDTLIGEIPLADYARLVTNAQNISQKKGIYIEQYGGTNQIQLNIYSFKNNVEIYQHGINNIADMQITGYENSIIAKQVGEGNYIELRQIGNHSITTIEQYGNFNQVIMSVQGNSQISRITQIGNDMTAVIRD